MPPLQTVPILLAVSNISSSIDSTLIFDNLNYIKDVILSLLEIIVGFIVLIFVSGFLIILSKKSKEIIILPFEVNSSKKTYNGNIISDYLVVEMRKIKEIHDHKFEEEGITGETISLPPLAPNTEKFETTVSNLGNVNVAGMTLSMGSILTIFKQFWPLGEPAKTIKGSLQESDSEIRLIARMEGSRAHGWVISRKIEQSTGEDKIPELIKDLAFMITYDLLKKETKKTEEPKKTEGITAKTWIGLKYFTKALDSYSQYTATKKPEHLEDARKNCIKASKEEKDYQILFNLFYILGISYDDTSDYYFAEDAFHRCITLMPKNEKGFIGLGTPLFYLGQYEEALEAYEKALEINPEFAEVWYNKGVVLGNLGRHEEALEACEKALEIKPEYAEAWNNKGYVLEKLGRHEEALKADEKALKIKPEYAYAWNNKGNALSDLSRYEEALEAYKKALKIKPEFAEAWNNKGTALDDLGRHEEALEAHEKALEIKPKYARAWYNRACAYSLMNKKSEALADLKHAIELDPSYREMAKSDKDFDKLWEDRDFKEIVTTNEED